MQQHFWLLQILFHSTNTDLRKQTIDAVQNGTITFAELISYY